MPSLWLVPCCRLLYPSGFSSSVTSSERPSGTTPSQPVTQPFPLPHGEEWPESLRVPGTSVLSAPSPPPTSSHLLLYTKRHPILIYYFIFFVVPPASSFPFPFSSKQAAVASGEGHRRRGGRNSPQVFLGFSSLSGEFTALSEELRGCWGFEAPRNRLGITVGRTDPLPRLQRDFPWLRQGRGERRRAGA